MKILITGANGFIGKNLQLHLSERINIEVICFDIPDKASDLPKMLEGVNWVFHLAGVNRPQNPQDFFTGNADLTKILCEAVCKIKEISGKTISLVYTSSIQAERDNPYGQSKLAGEESLRSIIASHNIPVYIFRLANVFGKWCRPNYNSVVATFCHNIAHGLPIQVNDPNTSITLVHIDDIVNCFMQLLENANTQLTEDGFATVTPQYTTTLGQLARQIQTFKDSRTTLLSEKVGTGLIRALYSTYVSYLPPQYFTYTLPQHTDPRGTFVEVLKTPDTGQFSYFTAHPGVTRGGHYHHTKTEKFLVIKGKAKFRFRHMHSGETHEVLTSGNKAEIVETVPGWTHDITNIGDDEMIVMLWANEVFERNHPDTYTCPL